MSDPEIAVEFLRGSISVASDLTKWLGARNSLLDIARAATLVTDCLQSGGHILACGNGGSMANAMHMAEELTGRYRKDRPSLAALAICDPTHLTCVGNDYGFERVFSRAVEAWGRAGDCVIGFSTSGESKNVLLAAESARQRNMVVIGMLGGDGGAMIPLCDLAIVVPSHTPCRVQEVHLQILHLVIELIERRLFPFNYDDN